MQISKETELREKFMNAEQFQSVCRKLGWYESDANNIKIVPAIDDPRKEIADFWLKELALALEEKVKEVKKIPSTCGKCKKKGVNTFGECECSFEDNGLVKRSDVIKILKQ